MFNQNNYKLPGWHSIWKVGWNNRQTCYNLSYENFLSSLIIVRMHDLNNISCARWIQALLSQIHANIPRINPKNKRSKY